MMKAVDMQIGTETTQDYGVKVMVTYGPMLAAVIFDVDDEEKVIEAIRNGFREARSHRDAVAAGGDGHVHDG
jgi:RNA binding exosome subunit